MGRPPKNPEDRVRDKAWYKHDYYQRYNAIPRHRRKQFLRLIFRKYGLTEVEFDRLLIESCGKCVCGKPFLNHPLDPCVDHDHETGEVRGLVHSRCNAVLGLVDDDPEVLRILADYLDR